MNFSLNLPSKRQFWAVSLGHFTNDVFMSITGVLLAFISSSFLPMSNTQIGFIVSTQQLAGALGQPFFGFWADKRGGRGIGGGGLALVVIGFCTALFFAISTQNYYLMLIAFIFQGLGSSMTHPVGSLHSAEADESRMSSNVSYFFLFGQLGLAVGPVIIGLLLDNANAGSLMPFRDWAAFPAPNSFHANITPAFFLGLAALPSIIFMYFGIPAHRIAKEKSPKKKEAGSRRASIMPLAIIALMVILRALAQPSSGNFVPLLFAEKGWGISEYGLITAIFSLASAITGVICGNLADRYDRRWIVLWSMALSAPAFYFLPSSEGLLAYLLAFLAGGLSGGAHSLIIVLAQELFPDSKGFASGAMLGFIFAAGGLGGLVMGILSDSIGLGTTFEIVAVLAFLSGFVALLLPKASINPT